VFRQLARMIEPIAVQFFRGASHSCEGADAIVCASGMLFVGEALVEKRPSVLRGRRSGAALPSLLRTPGRTAGPMRGLACRVRGRFGEREGRGVRPTPRPGGAGAGGPWAQIVPAARAGGTAAEESVLTLAKARAGRGIACGTRP
jgi:hypothetical protein